MRRVDHVSLYFFILLAVTVILKCESLRHENGLQSEMVTLTRSELRNNTHPSRHHSRVQGRAVKIPGSCYVCKMGVRGLMSYVRRRYARITMALCRIFISKLERKCQEKVRSKLMKLEPKIMKKLFPGGAVGVCRKNRAC